MAVDMPRSSFLNSLTKARPPVLPPSKLTNLPFFHRRSRPASVRVKQGHRDRHHRSNTPPRPRRQLYRLLYSPTDLLAQQLQSRGEPWTWSAWMKMWLVAQSKSLRLPVIVHQLLLRREESLLDSELSKFLNNPITWNARLRTLALKGIGEDDLDHWLWILAAEDIDTKTNRLVSTDSPKPIFLLTALLAPGERMQNASSLVALYDYIARTHCVPPSVFRELPSAVKPHSSDKIFKMRPSQFMIIIKRLVYHCIRTWPSSLVTVARLVISYLRIVHTDIVPNKTNKRTGYAERCRIFNCALCNFRRMSLFRPLGNMPHNWRAQKTLLSFSAGLKRPLIVDRRSYRAIRIVLLGLKKSSSEKMTARQHAKTWPPYRKPMDGTDEGSNSSGDWLSRSVKAGILKRQEGYSDDLFDTAIDTLGGAVPHHSITIQTRTGAPKLWTGKYRSLSVFSLWAARVKATRNAFEAWQMFQEPPAPGIRPNFQVYAEMFSKLRSAEQDYRSSILPGDAREVYPPHLVNLTDPERERLRPLSVDKLYEKMLRDGNRPIKGCLSVLVREAASLKEASRYLYDSPLRRTAVDDLMFSADPSPEHLQMIPLPVFHAYIVLLCRRQSRRRWESVQGNAYRRASAEVLRRYDHIQRAIRLVFLQSRPGLIPCPSAWHRVMQALAAKDLVLRPWCSQAQDDIEALRMILLVFDKYTAIDGLNPIAFDCLARCTTKALMGKSINSNRTNDGENLIEVAQKTLKSTLRKMTAPVKASSDVIADSLPLLYHEFSAAHVQTYLQTLALLGDADEAVRLVMWLLESWEQSPAFLPHSRDPGHKQWLRLNMAFICFRAFAQGCLSTERMEEIAAKFHELNCKGSTWLWPTDLDVDEYIERGRGEEHQR